MEPRRHEGTKQNKGGIKLLAAFGSTMLSPIFSFLWRVVMQPKVHPPRPDTASPIETCSIPNSNRGRALPRKWGELGEEPAARREKEPVPPPTNLPRPRSGPHSPGGGSGAAAHESAPSLPEAKPAPELIGPLFSARTSEYGIRLRLRSAKHHARRWMQCLSIQSVIPLHLLRVFVSS
jgi:hypothetical protein